MITLRATAIMKTDISGSTARFRTLPEPDLTALLAEHRELVTRLAAAHDGRIVKPEGDGFWLAFPSVTAGALAAMAMQEELRLAEATKGERLLAMRIVITLGDVLHQEGALVGEAVVLASRIEALTPPRPGYRCPPSDRRHHPRLGDGGPACFGSFGWRRGWKICRTNLCSLGRARISASKLVMTRQDQRVYSVGRWLPSIGRSLAARPSTAWKAWTFAGR